ncbi:MAG TPA: HAMP domain-containing sensor histidine kinase [Angustibacter sp.]|nr:HAMP domain-containing sensor histidine kinase [Angustibacter sp.]
MSGTPSPPADHSRLLFAAWVALATACLLGMLTVPSVQTVCFHLVWISMALVYGVQGWSARRTYLVLVVVLVATGVAMAQFVAAGPADLQELTEVPLMAAVFLTMVWHVRRRAEALAQTEGLIESERRAHEVKELFVRNCSHEMRTPITVARGFAEMVRSALPSQQSRDDIDVVVDELDKLAAMARRLLVLADAYEATDFDLAPVDLGALAQRSIQRWRPTADRQWVLEAPSAVIEADESRLAAAVDALVENAVKFTVDGDVIVIRSLPLHGGTAAIEVEDHGIGFARSRADDGSGPPASSGRPGTGLGLAIVRAIAEGHGGALTVDDAREVGALLRIELPAEPPAAPARRAAAATARTPVTAAARE